MSECEVLKVAEGRVLWRTSTVMVLNPRFLLQKSSPKKIILIM